MWISKKEVEQISDFINGNISYEEFDIRENKEGKINVLKNDIYSLVRKKEEQIKELENERNILSDYMADISHQLKTPISSMMIMADLFEDAEPAKRDEFIRDIKFSLGKMDWLLGALLKMAKIDAGSIEFSKISVQVSELVDAVMPSVGILLDINDQNISIKNDCLIHCDKRWTTEALTNIIKNAIEHADKESTIEIDSGDNPMYNWISVKNTGASLTKQQYYKLFRRFENSTNENGFGIGMPLALSIIKGQGGDIDVDFDDDTGTKFVIKMFK